MLFKNDSERMEAFVALMGEGIGHERARDMAKALEGMGFFTAPASTKYHGAYAGGLFDHSYTVTLELGELTRRLGLTWTRPESPYLVGMLHDLCKCDAYRDNGDGTFSWRGDQLLSGHGDKSAILALRLYALTEEETLCIRWHMGAYTDKAEWGYLDAAMERWRNVLWTHTADMIASKIRKV